MENKEFWQWFAGYFDAKGSIQISVKPEKPNPKRLYAHGKLHITSTRRDILEFILENLGITSVSICEQDNSYSIRISKAKDVIRITNNLYPLVRIQKRQLEILKDFYRIYGIPKMGKIQDRPSDVLHQSIDFSLQLSKLHKYERSAEFENRAKQLHEIVGWSPRL